MAIDAYKDSDKGTYVAVNSGSGTPSDPAVVLVTSQSATTYIQPFDSGVCLAGTGDGTPSDPFVQTVVVTGSVGTQQFFVDGQHNAYGQNSTVSGDYNSVIGSSTVSGNYNTCSGYANTLTGSQNTVSGNYNNDGGFNNLILLGNSNAPTGANQFWANNVNYSFDPAGAIVSSGTGLAANVDGATITIVGNQLVASGSLAPQTLTDSGSGCTFTAATNQFIVAIGSGITAGTLSFPATPSIINATLTLNNTANPSLGQDYVATLPGGDTVSIGNAATLSWAIAYDGNVWALAQPPVTASEFLLSGSNFSFVTSGPFTAITNNGAAGTISIANPTSATNVTSLVIDQTNNPNPFVATLPDSTVITVPASAKWIVPLEWNGIAWNYMGGAFVRQDVMTATTITTSTILTVGDMVTAFNALCAALGVTTN